MKTAALLFCSVILSFPLGAQTSQPSLQEKVDVNLVLLDATVTDNKGNQILGLTREDFTVLENGVPQTVDSIDYFTNRTLLSAPENRAAFKVERVREERYFVLFFHKALDSSLRSDLIQARRDAESFVATRLRPEDKVAVAGYDARLKIYSDFTSDKAQLRKALSEASSFSLGLRKVPVGSKPDSIMSNIDIKKMINDTGNIYEGLELLGEATRQIKARKAVMLFTPGIGEPGTLSASIPLNEDHYYDPMRNALNESNVSVYPIFLYRNAVGFNAVEDALGRVAVDTGGEYYARPVSFLTPLKLIEKENSGYYLLSYYSRKPEGKSGYQAVNVSVRGREFKVKARKGYGY